VFTLQTMVRYDTMQNIVHFHQVDQATKLLARGQCWLWHIDNYCRCWIEK